MGGPDIDGNGHSISLRVDRLGTQLGHQNTEEIHKGQYRIHCKGKTFSINKAEKALGYVSRVSLEEGTRRGWEWLIASRRKEKRRASRTSDFLVRSRCIRKDFQFPVELFSFPLYMFRNRMVHKLIDVHAEDEME